MQPVKPWPRFWGFRATCGTRSGIWFLALVDAIVSQLLLGAIRDKWIGFRLRIQDGEQGWRKSGSLRGPSRSA